MAFAFIFQLLFYACTLYNSGTDDANRLRRLDVLERALGPSAPGDPNLFAAAVGRLADFESLRQRLPLALTAAALWLAAIVFGDLCLLFLVPRYEVAGLERLVSAFGLGMGVVALAVQVLGLFGWLNRPVLAALATCAGVLWLSATFYRSRQGRGSTIPTPNHTGQTSTPTVSVDVDARSDRSLPINAKIPWPMPVITVVAVTPFVLFAFLAACLPTTDFDALAYHLLGPKEYWLQGSISRLPHNVYTHFPFHTEMFHLLAMTLLGDWRAGGLAGPLTIAMYGPATGAVVGLLAARWFSPAAGWLAALIYLTTPWTYRLTAIAYVEGALLFYTSAALLAAVRPPSQTPRWAVVAGALAGFACACKYPGLVVTALPMGWIVLGRGVWRGRQGRAATSSGSVATAGKSTTQVVALYAAGWVLAFGPWLIRNAVWTGNPVFPLAYQVFGGTGWSAERAERFTRAHRSTDFSLATIARYLGSIPTVDDWEQILGEIPARSDWQSALVFAFAPLALLGGCRRRAIGLWLLVGYLFLVFWGFTHRLDRFWLPLEPFAGALAGAGLVWSGRRVWQAFALTSCLVAVVYNLAYCTTSLCGVNAYDVDLRLQWQRNVAADPAMAVCNQSGLIRPDQMVLHVGSAAVFYAEPSARYHTVFDDALFERLVRGPAGSVDLRPAPEIRNALAELRADFVLIDWGEIARHRRPGGYGFSAFVRPDVVRALVRSKVMEKLATPVAVPTIVVWNSVATGPQPGDVVTAAEAARLPAGVEAAERVELFRVLREQEAAP